MIPSDQESEEVLKRARAALAAGDGFLRGNVAKIDAEFFVLDLNRHVDRVAALNAALAEIKPSDRRGPQPPNDLASHSPFLGARLYAYRWDSSHFEKRMYIKFALPVMVDGRERLALYSLHESVS